MGIAGRVVWRPMGPEQVDYATLDAVDGAVRKALDMGFGGRICELFKIRHALCTIGLHLTVRWQALAIDALSSNVLNPTRQVHMRTHGFSPWSLRAPSSASLSSQCLNAGFGSASQGRMRRGHSRRAPKSNYDSYRRSGVLGQVAGWLRAIMMLYPSRIALVNVYLSFSQFTEITYRCSRANVYICTNQVGIASKQGATELRLELVWPCFTRSAEAREDL
ncbi:hypothetical protein OG21DRAFT_369256 [Imleria badia]|nr:hypothetical protein OG21DRAFT_369256 [Imleria badia]